MINTSEDSKVKKSRNRLSGALLSALFAALISSAAFFCIPLPGGVPIVLQDMLALLSGLLLGPVWGSVSVFAFLVLGSIGLPVFSGKAGIMVIISGPTGGFLLGYLFAAFAGGLFLRIVLQPSDNYGKKRKIVFCILAALISETVLFTFGILGFERIVGKGFDAAVNACVIPFIPGMIIKTSLNVVLAIMFRERVQRVINKR